MSKEEVVAMIGDGPCMVKTLTRHHLYCEPPVEQPLPRNHNLREAPDALPEFTVSGVNTGLGPAIGMCVDSCSEVVLPAGTDGEPILLPGPSAI